MIRSSVINRWKLKQVPLLRIGGYNSVFVFGYIYQPLSLSLSINKVLILREKYMRLKMFWSLEVMFI